MIVIFWLFILFFLETVFLETAGNRFRFKRGGEGGRGVLMHSLLGVLVQAPPPPPPPPPPDYKCLFKHQEKKLTISGFRCLP